MIVRWVLFRAPWLLSLTVGVYLVHLGGPFIYDDIPYIVENEDLRQLWPPHWLEPGGGEHSQVNGRPVLGFTLALNYAFGGLVVWKYRLVNAVLHLVCTLVLYGVLRRLLGMVDEVACRAGELAFCSALLWSVHPLNSEVVYYIAQRSVALMGICYLATCYFFLRGINGGSHWLTAAVLCCATGMMAKETMVSAPLVILFCDRAFAGGSLGAVLRRRTWFYLGLAASWLVLIRGLWYRPHKETIVFDSAVESWNYLLNQCQMISTYIVRAFWPHPLVLDYGIPVPLMVGDVWGPGILIIGSVLLVGWALVRRPLWGWAGLSFFLLLAPTSSVVPIITEVGAERRMYLPLALIISSLIVATYIVLDRSIRFAVPVWIPTGAVVCAVVLLGGLTVRRGFDYRSEVAIWQSVVAVDPSNFRAQINLARSLQDQGDLTGALGSYRQALELDQKAEIAHLGVGSVLQMLGDNQAAVHSYRRALELKPDYARAYLNLGQIKRVEGDFAAAEELYRRALSLEPVSSGIHASLGKLFFARDRHDSAAVYFRRAIGLDPEHAESHNSLCTVLAVQGKYAAALVEYRRALELDPGYDLARDNMNNARRALAEP